jgi:hypothetical protein
VTAIAQVTSSLGLDLIVGEREHPFLETERQFNELVEHGEIAIAPTG